MKQPATLKIWTSKLAAKFCRARIEKANQALIEIEICYGDVDLMIVAESELIRDQMVELLDLINQAEMEERSL